MASRFANRVDTRKPCARIQLDAIEKELNTQGFDGIAGFLEALKTPPGFEFSDASGDGGIDKNFVFGTDGRTKVTALTTYPWRTMGRLWINNNGFGNCSGTMVGPFQFLTAGHCVHSGPSNTNGWAEGLTVSAGQGGTRLGAATDEFRRSDSQFYGEASWTTATTYNGWINNGNWDFDIALVRLDRNLGNQVGWLGYGYNSSNSYYTSNTGHTAGYPGDLTPNEFDMWYNFGNAGSHSMTTHQMRSNTVDIWPGQSGSSLYYCIPECETLRSAHGVVSHQTWSDINGNGNYDVGEPTLYNGFARITESKFNDLGGWMTSHAAPTDRADLTDWDQWFSASASFMSTTAVRPGSPFSMTTYPRNNGTANSGNYTVSFYASTNTIITSSDYLLGSVSMSSLAPYNWNTAALNLSSFPDIPVGNYYVGWVIDSGNAVSEYSENNNSGYIRTALLNVDKALPDTMTVAEGNAYFFSGASNDIVNDTLSFNAFIDTPSDIDSYYFATDSSGIYTIDVGDFGNATNPMVAVYNAATGSKIAWDNDSGPDDDARLSINLSGWTRYIVAVADYAESTTGDMSITIKAPTATSRATVGIDSVTGDGTISGNVDVAADTDYYVFTAPASAAGSLSINLTPSAGLNSTLVLWNAATGQMLAVGNNGGVGSADNISLAGVVPGTQYQLSVLSTNYATVGSFVLNVDFTTFVDTVAPTIAAVYATSSTWSATFIDQVDGGGAGNGNGFGVLLNGTSSIPPLPWAGIDRLVVQFSEDVVGLNASTLELRDSTGPLPISVAYDASTLLATVTWDVALAFHKIRLSISDVVQDAAGNALDGDGAGGAGGFFNLRFNVLLADGNGDGRVNGSDLSPFGAAFNSQIGQASYDPRLDWNTDGRINGGDLSSLSTSFNRRLDTLNEPGSPFGGSGGSSFSGSDRHPFDSFFGWLDEDTDDDWLDLEEDD